MTESDFLAIQSRRSFFRNCAGGIGTAADARALMQRAERRVHPDFRNRASVTTHA